MTIASRTLGIVALLCAVAAIGVQAAVVTTLWAQFTELLSPASTALAGMIASGFGLLLAFIALAVDRWRPSALVVIAGLANLGLFATFGWLVLLGRGIVG